MTSVLYVLEMWLFHLQQYFIVLLQSAAAAHLWRVDD